MLDNICEWSDSYEYHVCFLSKMSQICRLCRDWHFKGLFLVGTYFLLL